MERSETLLQLRGEGAYHRNRNGNDENTWNLREERFSSQFIAETPENAQRIILWCLTSDPAKRPTATELLKVRTRCSGLSLIQTGWY